MTTENNAAVTAPPRELPATRTTAPLDAPVGLKEWAVAIEVLGRGEQLVVLRKGGIDEKQFLVEHERFFLFPTYEHQQTGQLRPRYHDDLAAVMAAPRDPATVRLTHWAEVLDAEAIVSEARADALAAQTIWTPEYIRERLHWRPRKPLYALFLRVYRLTTPRDIPALPAYGGCRSWLDLDPALAGVDLAPVLRAGECAERVAALRARLAGAGS